MERDPGWELIRELSEWRPEGGVVSVYFEIDPADRSNGWRIALRDELAKVPADVASRVTARFPEGRPLPSGRSQIGFLEARGEREEWTSVQMPLREVTAIHAPLPFLTPLLQLVDEGGPFGVVVASLERVRVLEWSLGRIEELDGWELEVTSLDWRERKAPQRDPARGTGTSAAGHDQYVERLDHNRERFLKEAGALIAGRFGDRPWKRVVVIGETDRPLLLAKGLGSMAELVHAVPQDLIGEPVARIAERIAGELEHLNHQREEALVPRIAEGIGAEPGAAVGQDEVLRALEMGQARHVIFDPGYDFKPVDGLPASERFISLALATGADVTPAEGLAAAALGQHGGVAALLRFAIERSD
jgi:Bacterial archaeo-eukaryotic release factor family 10